jgi:ribosomal protein S27E
VLHVASFAFSYFLPSLLLGSLQLSLLLKLVVRLTYSLCHKSQASQFSDTYSSSIFEDNPLENLSYLLSDGATSFTPNALFQQTSTPTPDRDFARSLIAPLIPQTLERVGPTTKQKPFILWTEEMNEEFCGWWLMTEYGSQMKRNIFEKRRQADCWKNFHQVATIQDGSPKVMCKVCSQVLIHPAVGNRGTSSLNKHVREGVNCRRSKPSQDIRKLLQAGVW